MPQVGIAGDVPPQPYSGSPGWPPVTMIFRRRVGAFAAADGWACVVAESVDPIAMPQPNRLAWLSNCRREE